MKKIFLLVSLLALAAACTTEPSGNKDTSANANKGSEMKSTAGPTEADLSAKEKAGWEAVKAKNWDAFGKLLATDYVEAMDDGVHDRAATLAAIKDLEISDYTLSDWKMLPIDKDAAIITYTANNVKGTYKGEAFPTGPYHEAAAYVNRNGEWVAIYYQETLSRPPMPMASPTPGQSPKAATSPAAKPAETTSDVVANEKAVWQALQSKNYDAFASYLASDSMEIEADGVYDKAGSVKGVQGFDASKATLSDWKTAKLDDDASLVTYTVTLPGMKPDMKPMKEYHSTIWANRGGKWQALFHMGTPAASGMPAAGSSPAPGASKSPMKKM